MNLSMLSVGQKAKVLSIDGGHHQYRQRLFAAGLRPGVDIEMLPSAPLGDPLKLSIGGYVLALRAREAAIVQVKPLTDVV